MDGREFYDRVAAHAELEWLGAREGRSREDDEVLVGHTSPDTRRGLTSAMAVGAVLEHPWEELEAVLTGKRQGPLMTHLTRIVGYFSRVTNWNRSKIAELHDRHAGEYALAPSGDVHVRPAGKPEARRTDSRQSAGSPGRRAPALV